MTIVKRMLWFTNGVFAGSMIAGIYLHEINLISILVFMELALFIATAVLEGNSE